MILKLKFIKLTILIVFIIVIFTACSIKAENENNSATVKGTNYNEVIELGLQSEGLSLQDILYEETIGEDRFVFFTSHNALGFANVKNDKDGWVWYRLEPMFDFVSNTNPPPHYMSGGTEIEAPSGMKYFLVMGKIYNSDIYKITLSNDSINTIVREKNGNTFWFKLLENKDLNNDIKLYDKDGKELKY
jgi:hypothetical protein